MSERVIDSLPRGPHQLTRDEVAASQRRRILDGLVALATENGIDAVRIGEVCRRAGVSNTAFYALFPDKDGAFLAAYDEFAETVNQALYGGLGPERPWRESVRQSLRSYLDVLARHPGLTNVFIVQGPAASSAVRGRRREAHLGFTRVIQVVAEIARAQDGGTDIPSLGVRFAATEGLVGLVAEHVGQGGSATDEQLHADVCTLIEALLSASEADSRRSV